MGCKELEITDYYRFLEPGESVYARTRSFEKNRYKPVFHTVISNYRYYDAELGRWTSRDPIGEESFFQNHIRSETDSDRILELYEQSLMPSYLFVSNDPVGEIDLLGLKGGTLSSDYSSFKVTCEECCKGVEAAQRRCKGQIAAQAGKYVTARMITGVGEGVVAAGLIGAGAKFGWNPAGWAAFGTGAALSAKAFWDFYQVGRIYDASEKAEAEYCDCSKVCKK